MRLRLRDTSALAVGSALNGLLAYVFFALVTRHLGAVDAAPVSVLWTYWSFAAAVLTFPLQHWIARTVAAHRDEVAVRLEMPRLAGLILAVGALAGALSWLGRELLFDRDDMWFPVLVCTVTIGAGFIGVVRGGLAARHRFFANAGVLVGEGGSRVLLAVLLVVLGVQGNVGFGVVLAVGSLVGVLWPSAYLFDRGRSHRDRRALARRGGAASALAFLGGAGGGQLIGQAILTGGPVVLALTGGTPAEVTALFAGLALFRAPYTLGIGLVSQITGRLTALLVARQFAMLRRARLFVALGTLGTAVVAAAGGYWLGPWLIRLVFGPTVVLEAWPSLLLAVGSAFALGNLVISVALLAQNRAHALARGWVVSLAAGCAGFLMSGGSEPLQQTILAFLVAEAAAFVVLLLEDARGLAKVRARALV